MKKRKSTAFHIKQETTSKLESTSKPSKNRTSILNYFTPCEKPSSKGGLFVKKEESDIERISPNKRRHPANESGDDVIFIDTCKKAKHEQSAFLDNCGSEENLNSSNLKSSTAFECETSTSSFTSTTKPTNNTENDNERPAKDFDLNNLFQTPTKKQVSYPFDLTCPSPYYKNISEAMSNQSFQDINQYLNVHLEDINKVKTPTKSNPKKSTTSMNHRQNDASSVKKELSFNDSPTKSEPKDQKLNLTDKKTLSYIEITRKNFNTILNKVIDDPLNKCLFNDDDWNTISVYTSLSNDSQSLFLRLFFRKNSWIKRSSVKYDEFKSNLDELLVELLNSKFLSDTSELTSLEEGLYILEPGEVKEFAKQSKVTITGAGKKKMIDCILNFVRTTNTLTFSVSKMSLEERKLNELKRYLGDKGFKVNMDNAKVFLRILMLYFPPIFFDKNLNLILNETFYNLYNDSINQSTFPKLDSNKTIQVYTKRDDLVLYTDACILESMINENSSPSLSEINELIEKALEKYEDYLKTNLKQDITLPYFLRKLTAGQKLLRCISQCVTLLEKAKQYEEANKYLELLLKQNVYCLSNRGKW